jgi:hypothetical protein
MKNLRFFNLFLLAALICMPCLYAQETRPWFQNGPRMPRQVNTKVRNENSGSLRKKPGI